MRNRQPERSPEQGDDSVPVGQSANDRRLGKSGQETERGITALEGARDREQDETPAEDRGRDKFYPSQLGGPLDVARSGARPGVVGKGHDIDRLQHEPA